MRSTVLCCMFFLLAGKAESQRIEKLYDINWKETTPKYARYASEITKTDSGWLRNDYYIHKNTLQMKGLYKDSACTIENGWFYYVYPDGKLESKGLYINTNQHGLWVRYHANGYIQDSTVYNKGQITGTSIQWHNTGYMSDSSTYTDDGAVTISWFDDGALSSAGRFNKEGKPIGKWKFFHHNGNISSEELYNNGKLTQQLMFTEEGNPVTDTTGKNNVAAQFKGGIDGWLKYLNSKLYWPSGYQITNTDKVTIGVQFRVDETGTVKDVFIYAPFANIFDDVVMRILQRSPKWSPAISHNRKVHYFHKQTVTFVQQQN